MNSISFKLGALILSLFIIVFIPLGFVMAQIFQSYSYAHLTEETNELALMYGNYLEQSPNVSVEHLLLATGEDTSREVLIMDDRGEIVHATRDINLTQVISGQAKDQWFTDEETNRHYFYATQSITTGDKLWTIYVLTPANMMGSAFTQLNSALLFSGIGALLLAVAFTFILSRKFTEPLQEMERVSRQMAKGDLNVRVPVVSHDEVGNLATSMNDLAQELSRYQSNRKEFLANISHELRTPLSYLKGYIYALKTKMYSSEEEYAKMLTILDDETKRMHQLIDDLHELSMMESDQFSLEIERIDPNIAVSQAVERIEREALAKNLSVYTSFSNSSWIMGDSVRFNQMMLNLLHNAVSYTHSGSIHVEVNETDQLVQVMVKDTGIGIAGEDLPFVFERFYRAEKSRKRSSGGSGLGLAITKQLTLLMAGTIVVDSIVGEGTCFSLTFPKAQEGEE